MGKRIFIGTICGVKCHISELKYAYLTSWKLNGRVTEPFLTCRHSERSMVSLEFLPVYVFKTYLLSKPQV